MAQQQTRQAVPAALQRFAERLVDEIGACRVLLFGSHATGMAGEDSDYDLIVVAARFATVEPARRAIGLRQLWYAAGGHAPLDLICVTPDEFAIAHERISLIAAVYDDAIDLIPECCETAKPSTTTA